MTEPKLSKTHRWPPDLYARVEAIAKARRCYVQTVLDELIEIGLERMEAQGEDASTKSP